MREMCLPKRSCAGLNHRQRETGNRNFQRRQKFRQAFQQIPRAWRESRYSSPFGGERQQMAASAYGLQSRRQSGGQSSCPGACRADCRGAGQDDANVLASVALPAAEHCHPRVITHGPAALLPGLGAAGVIPQPQRRPVDALIAINRQAGDDDHCNRPSGRFVSDQRAKSAFQRIHEDSIACQPFTVHHFGPKPQFELTDGTPAVGYKLFTYVGGSVNTSSRPRTPTTRAGSANTNPSC